MLYAPAEHGMEDVVTSRVLHRHYGVVTGETDEFPNGA